MLTCFGRRCATTGALLQVKFQLFFYILRNNVNIMSVQVSRIASHGVISNLPMTSDMKKAELYSKGPRGMQDRQRLRMGNLYAVPSMTTQDLVDNKPLPMMVDNPPGVARVAGGGQPPAPKSHGEPLTMFEAEQMAKNSILQGGTGIIGLGSLSRI
jgi:hypothetical protein